MMMSKRSFLLQQYLNVLNKKFNKIIAEASVDNNIFCENPMIIWDNYNLCHAKLALLIRLTMITKRFTAMVLEIFPQSVSLSSRSIL